MNFYALSGLLTFITSLGFGIFSGFKGSKRLNKIWAIFCFCVAVWGWGAFKFPSTLDQDAVFFWLRFGHIGVILMPAFFLHFIFEFLESKRIKTVVFCYVTSLVFLIINFSDWLGFSGLLINRLRFVFNSFYVDSPPAPLYPAFLIYFFGTIIYAHYSVFIRYESASQLKKQQMKYFLAATVLGFCGGWTSFFMVFSIDIYPTLHITVPLYPIIMTYAIVNYKLMDIDVIIKKTLVFAGLLAFVFGIFSLSLFVSQEVLAVRFGFKRELSLAISIFLIVLGYEPMRKFLINTTDQFLFQKKYDYQKFLKDASKGMSQIESLGHLLKLVVHFVTLRMRLKNAAVLVKDLKTDEFHLDYLRGYPTDFQPKNGYSSQSSLIQYMSRESEAIEIEKIKEFIEAGGQKLKGNKSGFKHDFEGIKKEMESMKAACCVPSFLGHELRNILVLGEKKSGVYYTPDDLNVLFTLAQESAIAIENARLYDEAINRSKELERMNEKLQVTQASLIVAEKNATMVDMAKAIGHEVNNPLTGLTLQIGKVRSYYVQKEKQLLTKISERISNQKKAPFSENGLEAFLNDLEAWVGELEENLVNVENSNSRVDHSARRIGAVVHTLTDILKESKGEMTPLSLLVVFKEALSATRFLTYEENLAGCEIGQRIAAQVLIMGDLNQLLQVLVNLIKNAYEAMEHQKKRRITISGDVDHENPKMARIEISDNGPGIPPEVLPKIWMQGFSTKAKKDNSIGAAGQGQGLFVCKHIIESIHRGTITAESEVGKGTKFIVKLPLAELGTNV